jgi:hypothetical protein
MAPALARLPLSGKSCQTTTGEMAALSWMEQSAEMDGRLLPFGLGGHLGETSGDDRSQRSEQR